MRFMELATAPEPTPAQALLKRLRARLSQAEISRRTGIPQPTLSRWENSGVADAADDALRLVQLEAELAAPAAGPEQRA